MPDEKPHVLVVDDEPHNRDLLRRLLHSQYVFHEAADANEALAILQSEVGETICLILCDHLMPGKTGCELALENGESYSERPFVLLTGYDTDGEVANVVELGKVTQVVTKPWRSRELRALISELV